MEQQKQANTNKELKEKESSRAKIITNIGYVILVLGLISCLIGFFVWVSYRTKFGDAYDTYDTYDAYDEYDDEYVNIEYANPINLMGLLFGAFGSVIVWAILMGFGELINHQYKTYQVVKRLENRNIQ